MVYMKIGYPINVYVIHIHRIYLIGSWIISPTQHRWIPAAKSAEIGTSSWTTWRQVFGWAPKGLLPKK